MKIAAYVLEQLPRLANATQTAIADRHLARIFDLGAGSGEASHFIALRMREDGIDAYVDAIEPSLPARETLRATYANDDPPILRSIFDQPQGDASELSYDLVLAMHSLKGFPRLDDGRIPSLELVPHLLAPEGVAVVAIGPSELPDIERTLKSAGIRYAIGDTISNDDEVTSIFVWFGPTV